MNGHDEIVTVYFDDLDAMGIVHHARYAFLLDRALYAYWARQGHVAGSATQHTDSFQAVRELSLTYLRPITGPGEVLVRFWVDRLGRTSFDYGFRFLSPDSAATYVAGKRTMVRLDPVSMRPTPFTDDGRRALTALRADQPTEDSGEVTRP